MFPALLESIAVRGACTEDGSAEVAAPNAGGGKDMRNSRLEVSRESARFSDFEYVSGTSGGRM